jgi:hypothetical protein
MYHGDIRESNIYIFKHAVENKAAANAGVVENR